MVDVIVAKNKQAGIKPDTDGGLSRVVFNDRTLVSKMRSSHRGISVGQIAKFVAFFGLDANLLFSDTGKLFYNPGGKEAPAGNREVNNTRVEGNNHGSVTGKIKVNGDLVNGDKVGTIIQHARHIINNEFSKEHKDAFQEILDRIWDEARELERKVEEKGNELKKMAEKHENQLDEEQQRRATIETELAELKTEYMEVMKKCISQMVDGKNNS